MKRIVILLLVLALVTGGVIFTRTGLHRIYLPTATGITAKQVCSLHFVSGFTPQRARALYVDPLLGDAARLVSATVGENEVRSNLLGFLYGQRAVFREGIGCTLVHDGRDFDETLSLPWDRPFEAMTLDAAHRDAVFDTHALEAAIDQAFAEPEGGGRNTLAVVVLHEGRLVAERYGDGVTPATPLHGWSMTKSLAATLAGAMVHRGEITLQAQAITDEEVLEETPQKGEITLEHLLRMTAGLRLDERNDGTDPNSQMLFTQSDMAAWAARQPLVHEPGTHWQYMSGQTVLATRAMQDALPGPMIEDLAAVRARVFAPLAMHSAIFETDEAGTLQGSSYMYAAAQDWARMGQAYLDDGLAPDGTRVFGPGFDEIVATHTVGGTREGAAGDRDYGLGFWLGHPSVEALSGTVYMGGFQGQRAFIVPDADLVVVRLGATNFADDGTFALLANVFAALRPQMDPVEAVEGFETPGPADLPVEDEDTVGEPEGLPQ